MTNKINELDKVLKSVENKPTPLWFIIKNKVNEIEEARLKGVTYKEMAAALGVTYQAFYDALKKAKKYNEQQKQEEKPNSKKKVINKQVLKDEPPPLPGRAVKKAVSQDDLQKRINEKFEKI